MKLTKLYERDTYSAYPATNKQVGLLKWKLETKLNIKTDWADWAEVSKHMNSAQFKEALDKIENVDVEYIKSSLEIED